MSRTTRVGMVGKVVGGWRIFALGEEGVLVYRARCMFCGKEDTLTLPQMSTGKKGCVGCSDDLVSKNAIRRWKRKLAHKRAGRVVGLRKASPSEQPGSKSRYKGVSWDKGKGMWRAYALVSEGGQKRRMNVGYFHNEEEAGAAAEVGRRELAQTTKQEEG